MSTKLSRRTLLRLRPTEYLQLFRDSQSTEPKSDHRRYFRPPGAIPREAEFLRTCERCGECAKACPFGVIEKLGAVAGNAEGTPVIRPEKKPCHWCENMDCIRACPSGALSFQTNGTAPPIGKAVLDVELCLNLQGTLCDTCAIHCPPSLKAITMHQRRPHLDPARCVGCGLCAYFCESSPSSIHIEFTTPEPALS